MCSNRRQTRDAVNLRHDGSLPTFCLLAALLLSAAEARGAESHGASRGSPWFLDIAIGGGTGRTDPLLSNNAVAASVTSNPVMGDRLILVDADTGDYSLVAAAALGYLVTGNTYLKVAYRYFGSYETSGFTHLPPALRFKQVMSSMAHGAFVGIGTTYHLAGQFYLDAAVEVGAALILRRGIDDVGTVIEKPFPAAARTNLAIGAAVGLGYRMTSDIALTLTGSYHYLGHAATGVMCHCIPGTPGENASEQLSSDFSVFSVLLGVRMPLGALSLHD